LIVVFEVLEIIKDMIKLLSSVKVRAFTIAAYLLLLGVAYSAKGQPAEIPGGMRSAGAKPTPAAVRPLATAQPAIQVPAADYYTLQKVAVLKESQSEIIEGLQTKFSVFIVLAAIVGFFGIRSLIREFISSELKDAMRAAADAQAATTLAKDSVKELRSEAAKYRESVEEATLTATSLNSRLDELRSRIEAEGDRSVAASEIKIEGLQTQVDTLKAMIDNIAVRQIPGTELPKEAAATLERAKLKASIDEQEFLQRSGTRIVVAAASDASALGAELAHRFSKLGYRARLLTWSGDRKEPGTVAIKYMPHAAQEAEAIEDLLRDEFSGVIKVTSRISIDKPVKNTDDEISVLLA
jgi:hypothetical protein